MIENGIKQKDASPDWRWLAVAKRNGAFDGVFYFGVRTTGIFCRPSCASRPPKRENVACFEHAGEALEAGFRACLRCRPLERYFPGPQAELIARAMRLLERESG